MWCEGAGRGGMGGVFGERLALYWDGVERGMVRDVMRLRTL